MNCAYVEELIQANETMNAFYIMPIEVKRNLGAIPHLPPCLRQGLCVFDMVYARLVGL